MRAESRSLRTLRLRARAPRVLTGLALGLVVVAGLRALVQPAPAAPKGATSSSQLDPRVGAFAEGFARAYLSWDADKPEERERLLRGYLSRDLDPDGGLPPSGGDTRRVAWSAVAAERASGSRINVTVVAERDGEVVYLSVPVERDRRGFLSVVAYPALVGPPATDTASRMAVESEVEDSQLRAVCERAVHNYLAGGRRNLAADLAPAAVVSLPTQRLELGAVDSVTWAQPGRWAAVQVRAEDEDGAAWTLRYELRVVRHERWYVRAIQVDPRSHQGGTR